MKAQPTPPTIEALKEKIVFLEETNEILRQHIDNLKQINKILKENYELAKSVKEDYKSVINGNLPYYKAKEREAAAESEPRKCKVIDFQTFYSMNLQSKKESKAAKNPDFRTL